jgi:hypothetical protein
VTPGDSALRIYLRDGKGVLQPPSGVLYRADLVRERNAFFPEESLVPDMEVWFPLLIGRKLGFVHKVLTYERVDVESISGNTWRFNPGLVHNLILMQKYGPQLLSAKEYDERFFSLERPVMRFLGRSKLKGESAEFWEYQRKGFAAMNKELSQGRLWWEATLAAIELISNPASLWRSLKNRFQQSISRERY